MMTMTKASKRERRGDWRVGSPSSQHQAANSIANTVNCELPIIIIMMIMMMMMMMMMMMINHLGHPEHPDHHDHHDHPDEKLFKIMMSGQF